MGERNTMRVTAFGDNLIQLTQMGLVNCFLVRENDGFTLIDTGAARNGEAILAAVEKHNLPIARIALTHAHVDHVGSLDELHQLIHDADVLISARDARFLAGDMSLDPDEPDLKLRGGYPQTETRPTHTLQPGDRIGSLEVVAAPGHTPGHVAFLDSRDRTLIAGDAFQTKGGLAVSGDLRLLFPAPAMATWNKPLALQSARALRVLEPALLAVGHGPTLVDPLPQIDHAIRRVANKFAS
jgi:glyoxylase-like metal-dependent hydrolase (beta-lactamase superfamily II)